MKGITRSSTLCLVLGSGASAFVGVPLTHVAPTVGIRALFRAPSMTVTPPAPVAETEQHHHHHHQHRHPGNFAAVEFDGIREAFDAARTSDDAESAKFGFDLGRAGGAGLAVLTPLVMGAAEASAKGGEFGIFEGKTASFLHPIIMGVLFTVSVRAAILGLEWRELRTMSTRMSDVKAQLPMLSTGSRASTPLKRQADDIRQKLADLEADAAEQVAGLKADIEKLTSPAAAEIEEEIQSMTNRRKELASKNVRDRHYDTGALLLGLGTFAAIEGPVNTFLRAQKLFPGPHLYVGAGCVVAWAVSASLVPQMQKGNEVARTAHIVINFGMIGLFAWQIWTGIPIAQKVWEFTKFP